MTAVLETTDHAAQVVCPFRLADLLWGVEIEVYDIRVEGGGDAGLVGAIRTTGDDDVAVDGEGHDEAVAVVDVLAYQVHAAGCGGGDGGLGLKMFG